MKIQALENEMSGLKSEMKKCYEFSNLHPVTDEISLNEGTALVATETESTSQIVISPIRQLDGLDDTECSECIDRFVGVVEDVDTCGFCEEDLTTMGEYLDHMDLHGFICPRCLDFYSGRSWFHLVDPT